MNSLLGDYEENQIENHNHHASPYWKIWLAFCQIRFGYCFFLISLFLIVFSFTTMMEMFFAIFLPEDSEEGMKIQNTPFFLAFPLLILALGWIFGKVSALVVDCFNPQGGMLRLRLVQLCFWRGILSQKLTGSEYQRINSPENTSAIFTRAHHYIVDFVQPILFDFAVITTISYEIWTGDIDTSEIFTDIIRVGVSVSFFYLIGFIAIELIVRANTETRHLYLSQLRKAEAEAQLVLESNNKILPILGFTLLTALVPDKWLRWRREVEKKDEQYFLHVFPPIPVPIEIILWLALYIVGNVLTFYHFISGFFLMMFSLLMLVGSVERKFSEYFGRAFQVFVFVFLVLSAALFSLAIKGGAAANNKVGVYNLISPSNHEMTATSWNRLSGYPVCAVDYYGLHILDLNLLASSAYLVENKPELIKVLHQDFDSTDIEDWELQNITVQNYMAFYEIYFHSINTTVISIRGTCTGMDALQDMHYWFGISFLQLLTSYIFPVVNQMPTSFVQYMLAAAALSATKFVDKEPNYQILLNYVKGRKNYLCNGTGQNCNLLIVGHSLGGGMAALAGSANQIPAISFSGPGLKYNALRFGVDEKDLKRFVTTIKPDHDVVPAVDMLEGDVQEIDCPYSSPLACHMLPVAAVTLKSSCGDPRQRGWANTEDYVRLTYGDF